VATMWRKGWYPAMTHECRLRKLQTNFNHASLSHSKYCEITREYQFDSPSINFWLLQWEFSRDGPVSQDHENVLKRITFKKKLIARLTGSFISVA